MEHGNYSWTDSIISATLTFVCWRPFKLSSGKTKFVPKMILYHEPAFADIENITCCTAVPDFTISRDPPSPPPVMHLLLVGTVICHLSTRDMFVNVIKIVLRVRTDRSTYLQTNLMS